MQRIVIIFSILLALCAPAWAVEVDAINGIPVSKLKAINGVSITKIKAWDGFAIASTATCTVLSANTSYTDTIAFHRYNNQQYQGVIWDDGASGSICKFRFWFTDNVGDISGLDYYAEVWLLGASSVLDTLISRSDKVDGDDTWSLELVDFVFSSVAAYDCTGANQYGIFIKAVANDAAASSAGTFSDEIYPRTRYSNGTNNMSGVVAVAIWNIATSALTSSDANDMPVAEVWTMQ